MFIMQQYNFEWSDPYFDAFMSQSHCIGPAVGTQQAAFLWDSL